MRFNHVFLILSLSATNQAHGISLIGAPELELPSILGAREEQDVNSGLLERETNACGNSTGISCPANQCCGANGYCGTGPFYCSAPDCQFMFGPACDANVVPRGRNTASLPRPLLGSVQYGGVTITNCAVPGTVAMTYDDGPGPYTAELLDMLAKANVKSTFFITGNNNGKGEIDDANTPWPAIIKRMHREGHQIASHSWSHPNFDSITTAQRKDELVRNEIAFSNILGFFPTYMRPPFTYCQASTGCTGDIASLGYHIVTFMIDPKDYLNDSPELIQNSINIFDAAFANANPQSQEYLPYAHDIHEQSVVSLTPHIIKAVQSKGFKMVTVGECLNDPIENWYRNPNDGGRVTSVQALAASSTVLDPNTSTSMPVSSTTSRSTTISATTSVQSSGSTARLSSSAGTSSSRSSHSTSASITSHTGTSATGSASATNPTSSRPNAGNKYEFPHTILGILLGLSLALGSV